MTEQELKNKLHKVRDNRREAMMLRAKAGELRRSAMDIAIRYDKEHVQTSPMNYQEQALVEAADLDAKAETLITEGDILRTELLNLINKLDDINDQMVLIKHYFNGVTFRDMAFDDHYNFTTYWYRKENAIKKICNFSTNSTDSTKDDVI